MRRAMLSLTIAATLGGCSFFDRLPGPGEGPSSQLLLVPAAAVTIMETALLERREIAMGVALWALADPLAPNWQIHAAQLDERNVRFSLKHKLLHTGGEGEARQVLKRSAERIALEQGFSEYEIIRYQAGIDSTRPFARRTVVADVRMLRGRALPGL